MHVVVHLLECIKTGIHYYLTSISTLMVLVVEVVLKSGAALGGCGAVV